MAQEYERIPGNPIRISTKGRKIFRELYKTLKESGNWADGFEYGLSVLAQAYDYYDQCVEQMEGEGLFYESKTLKRKHPAFELMSEQVRVIKELSAQFKLAPRFRDKAEKVHNQDDPVKMLLTKTDQWKAS